MSMEVNEAPLGQTRGAVTHLDLVVALLPAAELTFGEQKLYGTEVTLAGRHHQKGPALLVAHVDVGTTLQQPLCNLKTRPKTLS